MNDGGPAFPITQVAPHGDPDYSDYIPGMKGKEGMSLRDYFAAAAMNTLIRCASPGPETLWVRIAEEAYRSADAMLKEREKNGNNG